MAARPFVPVYLFGPGGSIQSPYYALLDSGADVVLLPSELGKEAGVDVVSGKSYGVIGVGGQKVSVYYHNLELQLVGDSRKLSTIVGLSDQIFTPLLGRSFFQHYKKIIFSEPKGAVEFVV